MSDAIRQAAKELAEAGFGGNPNEDAPVSPVKKTAPPAPAVPQYSGGKASEKLSPGIKKSLSANTRAQEIFQQHDFSAIEEAVIWFKENKDNLKPRELHQWLTFFAKHESPEIKAVEGQQQVDANISVTLNQFHFTNASPQEIALKGKTIDIDEAAEIIGKPSELPDHSASEQG